MTASTHRRAAVFALFAGAGGLLAQAAESTEQPTAPVLPAIEGGVDDLVMTDPLSFDPPDDAFIARVGDQDGAFEGVGHVALYWENDGSYVKPFDTDDRYYTNGIKLELSFAPIRTPKPAAWVGSFLGYDDPRSAYGLRITHQMHTPDDITIATPQPADHPWSGHIGIAGFVQLTNDGQPNSIARMDHIQAEIGWVGERAGAAGLQTFVHAAAPNQVKPRGWSNQLSNEITASIAWERRWRLVASPVTLYDASASVDPSTVRGMGWDVIPSVGITAGTPRVDAHAGIGVRFGWNLPGDFGPARADGFRDATWDTLRPVSDAERGPFSFYTFAEFTGRAVAWDMFIEGNALAAGPDGVSARTWVFDVYTGFAARYGWFELAWGFTFENERFEGQSGGHIYGTWRFGANFEY